MHNEGNNSYLGDTTTRKIVASVHTLPSVIFKCKQTFRWDNLHMKQGSKPAVKKEKKKVIEVETALHNQWPATDQQCRQLCKPVH